MVKRSAFLFFLTLLFISFFIFSAWQKLPDGKMHFFAIDVGQGDASLMITPAGHHILIDGGPGKKILKELGSILPFFDRYIDLLVLTHSHADHLNGLIPVIENHQIKNILVTGEASSAPAYEKFWQIINNKKIPWHLAQADQDFLFGKNFSYDVIYPKKIKAGQKIHNKNSLSSVALATFKKSKILLTGDAEKKTEKLILKTPALIKADILKVGHHGSKSSSSKNFLHAASPKIFTISLGKNNKFRHPHLETLKNINPEKTFRTDQAGSLHFVTSGDG